jgi:glycerophosphoryl diester phosphodiesterase
MSLESIDYDLDKYKNFLTKIELKKNHKENNLPIIAHAGGGYNKLTYTNSINSLEQNKDNYQLFELDFFLTEDGKLVCSHDWSINLESFLKFEKYAQTKKEYEPCTYKSLKKWLKSNPKKKIVTDFKSDNLYVLTFIAKNFNDFEKTFIPQIYNPKEYKKVKNIGFKDIIWTLYRYNKNNKKIIKLTKQMDLFAITMPKNRAQSDLPHLLKINKIRSYVHTINSMEEYFIYTNYFEVDQIYSDWIK